MSESNGVTRSEQANRQKKTGTSGKFGELARERAGGVTLGESAIGETSDITTLHVTDSSKRSYDFENETINLAHFPQSDMMFSRTDEGTIAATYMLTRAGNLYITHEEHDDKGISASVMRRVDNITDAETSELRDAHRDFAGIERPDASDTSVDPATQDPGRTTSDGRPYPTAASVAQLSANPRGAKHADALSKAVYHNDPRVQNGEVFDTVVDEYGTVYHRARRGIYPGTPYAMRFQSDRPLNDAEMAKAAQLIGYQYRVSVDGEPMPEPVRDSPYSFVVHADTTKSSKDDVGEALVDFESGFDEAIANGSPVRTTDRAGAGTRGTRLVSGFGPRPPKFEIYYDDANISEMA